MPNKNDIFKIYCNSSKNINLNQKRFKSIPKNQSSLNLNNINILKKKEGKKVLKIKESENLRLELINYLEKYYILEKSFINSLNQKCDKKNKVGYLIDSKCFNEWKKSLNYKSIESIFDKYLKGDKTSLTKEDKIQIQIDLKEKKMRKNTIKSLHFSTIEELKDFNKVNNIIFISCELFNLINDGKEEKNNEIRYLLKDEKRIELIINNNNQILFRFENIIYSYIHFNITLLTKLYMYNKKIFREKKPINIYIFDKKFLLNYKEVFHYKQLKNLIKKSNLRIKNDEKQLFEFIESLSNDYIDSIKEKINIIKFNTNNIIANISTKKNDITFEYIDDFDNMFFDGASFISFIKFHNLNKALATIVRIFFIKEKILMLFENKISKKIYGQLGTIIDLEKDESFNIEYLIAIKENKNNNISINVLDHILKEKKDFEKFYEKIYGNNSNYFEYQISETVTLYILKRNEQKNIINEPMQNNHKKNKIPSLIINKEIDEIKVDDNKNIITEISQNKFNEDEVINENDNKLYTIDNLSFDNFNISWRNSKINNNDTIYSKKRIKYNYFSLSKKKEKRRINSLTPNNDIYFPMKNNCQDEEKDKQKITTKKLNLSDFIIYYDNEINNGKNNKTLNNRINKENYKFKKILSENKSINLKKLNNLKNNEFFNCKKIIYRNVSNKNIENYEIYITDINYSNQISNKKKISAICWNNWKRKSKLIPKLRSPNEIFGYYDRLSFSKNNQEMKLITDENTHKNLISSQDFETNKFFKNNLKMENCIDTETINEYSSITTRKRNTVSKYIKYN